MTRPRNRTVALLAAGAVALGAGGATIGLAHGGGFGGGGSPAKDLADALNKNEGTKLTEQDVREAMDSALKARLDEAVAAGRLTQDEANEIEERREKHEQAREARIAPIASALGMTAEQIREERHNGKTLAELAESKNVSRDKLLAAIKDGIQAAAKVQGLTIDADRLNEMAERLADGTGRGPGGHGPRGGGGPGGGFPFGP